MPSALDQATAMNSNQQVRPSIPSLNFGSNSGHMI